MQDAPKLLLLLFIWTWNHKKIGQSSHKIYSNKILNFQESTTILNACTKRSENLLNAPHTHTHTHIYIGSTRAEEKPLRDTACRLRGKGLDMPCDSYWGWLSWFYRTFSHFVSFKNRNHWPQFESCLESSSDHGAICIKLDLVESEKVFSMKVIHAESPFPCDYVRNSYCKRVITSTAESKRVF